MMDPVESLGVVVQMAKLWKQACNKLTSARRSDESDMTALERVIADHIAVRKFLYEHASPEDQSLLDRRREGSLTEILQRTLLNKPEPKLRLVRKESP